MSVYILGKGSEVLSHNIEDYPEGIIIPIDKPYRWTSADVIRKIKFAACRHFGKRNLKVGHAGTLDPLATGVLLVCIGKATRLAETLQSHDKEYIAGISFGATTPSYDLEKEIDRFFPHEHITEEAIEEALQGFIGEQEQVAPLFSAKSVDGVRAYELARKLYGKAELDEAAKELLRVARIRISELELLEFERGGRFLDCARNDNDEARNDKNEARHDNDEARHDNDEAQHDEGEARNDNVTIVMSSEVETSASKASLRINVTDNSELGLPRAAIRMACSKGTYVRAFARDLGETLNSGAHLDSLQRSRSGDFRVENALSIQEALTYFPHEERHHAS